MTSSRAQPPSSAWAWALLGLLLIGCGHGPPVAEPPLQPAPQPPAATGLAVLLESGDQLGLTAEQKPKIEALAQTLAHENGPLQAQLDNLARPAPASGEAAGAGMGGPHGGGANFKANVGGMGAGGMGYGRSGRGRGGGLGGGRGGGGGHYGGGRPSGSPARPEHPGEHRSNGGGRAEAGIAQKMAENHARALRAALDVLEPAQRENARRLLSDEGYDEGFDISESDSDESRADGPPSPPSPPSKADADPQ